VNEPNSNKIANSDNMKRGHFPIKDSSRFLENYFRILSLAFWPIIWYKWIAITDRFLEISLVCSFSLMSILYVILFLYIGHKGYYHIERIEVLYRFSTIIAFISTLLSFVSFPRNVTALLIKMGILLIYFLVSLRWVVKYKNDQGVVGIMASILLTIITLYY
jgi:hypothetical protein